MVSDESLNKHKLCKHYLSPLHFDECAAGVNYLQISNGGRDGYLARLPCVTTSLTRNQQKCDSYCMKTEEELKDEYEKFNELINGLSK